MDATSSPQPKPNPNRRLLPWIGGGLLIVCLVCGFLYAVNPKTAPQPTIDAAAIYTAAAQTMIAQMAPQPSLATSAPVPGNPAPAPTAASAGSTRDNPLPGPRGVEIGGGVQLVVASVIRPADSTVTAGNMFNSTPAADMEYLIVQIQVICVKSQNDKCMFTPSEIKAVGSDGQVHDEEFAAGVPGRMEEYNYEFFGGSNVNGVLVFLVPKNDPSVVLYHEPLFLGSPVYFSLQ